MQRSDFIISLVLKTLAAAVGLILLMRFFPPLRMAIVGGLVLALFGLLMYALLMHWRQRRDAREESDAILENIDARRDECNEHVAAYESEVKRIESDITELREQAERSPQAPEGTRAAVAATLRDLEAERDLRRAKLDFFTACLPRLDALRQQHLLQKKLDEKQREVRRLREKNYDDLAAMEAFRYQLDADRVTLETMADLSRQVVLEDSPEHTARLRERLQALQV